MENQPKDFDRWNASKKKINLRNRPLIRIGGVYWCSLGTNIGVEQDGSKDNFQRLVLVLKKFSNKFVLIVPLTTKNHLGIWYVNTNILNKSGNAILNQVKPIDTKRLIKRVGEISENETRDLLYKYIDLLL